MAKQCLKVHMLLSSRTVSRLDTAVSIQSHSSKAVMPKNAIPTTVAYEAIVIERKPSIGDEVHIVSKRKTTVCQRKKR